MQTYNSTHTITHTCTSHTHTETGSWLPTSRPAARCNPTGGQPPLESVRGEGGVDGGTTPPMQGRRAVHIEWS